MIILIILLVISFGWFTGLQDDELFHKKYMSKKDYNNKYKKDAEGNLVPAPNTLYYRIFKLKHAERFPLSATALVAFTDKWHAYKTVAVVSQRTALTLALGVFWGYSLPVLAAIWAGLWALHALSFHVTYTWL